MNVDINEVREFSKGLLEESDRGCVLVACSYIEDHLGALVRKKLHALSKASKSDIDSLLEGPLAPISTFAIRTRLAYAMGLIDRNLRDGLDSLRSLRNEFAHRKKNSALRLHITDNDIQELQLKDFDVESISQMILDSPALLAKQISPARAKFIVTVGMIKALIAVCIENVK